MFSSANEQISLTFERYLEWVITIVYEISFHRISLSLQISIVDSKRARIIIEKATNHYPNDPSLWNKRLSLVIENTHDSQTIKNQFKLICKNSDVKVNHYFPRMLVSNDRSRILLSFGIRLLIMLKNMIKNGQKNYSK